VTVRAALATAIALATTALLAACSGAAEGREVRVGLYENPPKVYTAPDGTPTGMFPMIIDAIAAEAGWQVEYVPCTWEECLASLQAGDLDLMPDVAWSAERDEVMDFPSVSVANSWSQVYVRPGLTVTGLPDLDGARIALLSGGIQEQQFTDLMEVNGQSFVPVPVDSLAEGYQAVADGYADAVITNSFYAAWNGSEYQLTETPIVFLPSALYVATAAGANADLLATMDDYLGAWRTDPDSVYFDALIGTVAAPPAVAVPRWLVYALLGLVGVALIAAVLAWVLRRQVVHRPRDLEASEEKYRDLETRDPVTGLPNRALLAELVRRAIEEYERDGGSCSLLLVELHDFASVNESLGHHRAQQVVRLIADRLSDAAGPSCTVARTGVGEFTILVPEEARLLDGLLAQGLLDSVQQPLDIEGEAAFVGACVGIARYPADGDTAEAVERAGESALRLARQAGPGSVRYSTPDATELSRQRMALRAELRAAIDRGELVLHYQPQVSLVSGTVVGLEALVRWNHPARGLLPPGEFILLAEDSGLITPLGEWVLREAGRQVTAWRSAGHRVPAVAVNLSASQLSDESLVARVTAALADAGLEPEALELEITETAVMVERELASHSLDALNAMGVPLAIDDFGTGYSSLAYLRSIRVDKLKIDMSFIRGMVDNPEDVSIVRAIVAMGHSLGLTVVAEGVETDDQRTILAELGCDAVQGYLVARPLPADEVQAWLTPAPV
jgi:diguanylate cyclase (GGDEF)-like protein